jgi:hypothetical protein
LSATHSTTLGSPTTISGLLTAFIPDNGIPNPPGMPGPPPGSTFSLSQTASDGATIAIGGQAVYSLGPRGATTQTFDANYNWSFTGGTGANSLSLTGQIGITLNADFVNLESLLIDDAWVLNGVVISQNEQLLVAPLGGTASYLIMESIPPAAAGLNSGSLGEGISFTPGPAPTPAPPAAVLAAVGAAILGWRWGRAKRQ